MEENEYLDFAAKLLLQKEPNLILVVLLGSSKSHDMGVWASGSPWVPTAPHIPSPGLLTLHGNAALTCRDAAACELAASWSFLKFATLQWQDCVEAQMLRHK